MGKRIVQGWVAAVAALVLSTLGVASASTAGAAAKEPRVAAVRNGRGPASPGDKLWVHRSHRRGNAASVAVSPDGNTVFVTGRAAINGQGYDYGTVAYNAATGSKDWRRSYNGPANGNDGATSLAVSPDGTTVFVTGYSAGINSGTDYATLAYDAATGKQRWVRRYNGPGNGNDEAYSVAVSPDGTTVYVTGYSTGTTSGTDYTTVAYSAATGAQQWAASYNGPANGDDVAYSLAVSPTGGSVFVTGYSTGTTSGTDYATVAYNAATGAQQWVQRYNGPGNSDDGAASLAVSPDGTTVFVTGYSTGTTSGTDYATVAYNAATGAQQWVQRYNGPGNGNDEAYSVAVSPTGGAVFVTGYSTGTTSGIDYATVAYNAATGARQWAQRYNGPGNGNDEAYSVAVSPDGSTVYVTGRSTGTTSDTDYATVAYNAVTGAQQWVQRYNGAANLDNGATSVAVSGDGTVFVTGSSQASGAQDHYATVAYSG